MSYSNPKLAFAICALSQRHRELRKIGYFEPVSLLGEKDEAKCANHGKKAKSGSLVTKGKSDKSAYFKMVMREAASNYMWSKLDDQALWRRYTQHAKDRVAYKATAAYEQLEADTSRDREKYRKDPLRYQGIAS